MTWLVWRQYRAQAMIAAVLLLGFGVSVWLTGRRLVDQFAACRSGSCGGLFQNYQGINLLVDLTVAVPLLIGVFFGATVIGRELESGTASLVWTQSVTRRRWLVSKIVSLLAMTLLVSGATSALVTWWSNTHNILVETRFTGLQFDIQNLAPVGYALFASAAGLAAGVIWRRTLPAMASTVGAYIAARLLVELYAQPHFMAPLVAYRPVDSSPDAPAGGLPILQQVTLHGRVLSSGVIRMPVECTATASRRVSNSCMQKAGYAFRITYQPADRYWTFQWIEFGIFAGLAALLIALGVVVLLRHDA